MIRKNLSSHHYFYQIFLKCDPYEGSGKVMHTGIFISFNYTRDNKYFKEHYITSSTMSDILSLSFQIERSSSYGAVAFFPMLCCPSVRFATVDTTLQSLKIRKHFCGASKNYHMIEHTVRVCMCVFILICNLQTGRHIWYSLHEVRQSSPFSLWKDCMVPSLWFSFFKFRSCVIQSKFFKDASVNKVLLYIIISQITCCMCVLCVYYLILFIIRVMQLSLSIVSLTHGSCSSYSRRENPFDAKML